MGGKVVMESTRLSGARGTGMGPTSQASPMLFKVSSYLPYGTMLTFLLGSELYLKGINFED